jgi:hypothetical protein
MQCASHKLTVIMAEALSKLLTAKLLSSLYKPRTDSTGFLLDSRLLKMGPVVCHETSISNYSYSLRQ